MPRSPAQDVRGLPGVEALFRQLRRRGPRNADRLDRELEARCVRELTILMCDSSGFTRRTHDYGILPFLAAMTRAYDLLEPRIAREGGALITRGADNLLAVFPDPAAGVRAAIRMQRALAALNARKGDIEQFQLCMGLHHGKVLRLKDGVFGDKVNVAAKIGEDLASADEIIVTGEVAARLPARVRCKYLRSVALGGKTFELHRVEY